MPTELMTFIAQAPTSDTACDFFSLSISALDLLKSSPRSLPLPPSRCNLPEQSPPLHNKRTSRRSSQQRTRSRCRKIQGRRWRTGYSILKFGTSYKYGIQSRGELCPDEPAATLLVSNFSSASKSVSASAPKPCGRDPRGLEEEEREREMGKSVEAVVLFSPLKASKLASVSYINVSIL